MSILKRLKDYLDREKVPCAVGYRSRVQGSAIATAWRSMWTSPLQRMKRSSFRPGRAMRQRSSVTRTLPAWSAPELPSFMWQPQAPGEIPEKETHGPRNADFG